MLKQLTIAGFKSFAKKTSLTFDSPITAIVGPNGSGKSNVVEAIRFVLGEQSMKSLRGKGGSDLIWKGSKLLGSLSKASVAIEFDNRDKKFSFSSSSGASADLSFNEVKLVREVSKSDGSNYSINGTNVRLKDISELLGSVHIGSSGHHIISQGEADRLLSASAKERRTMVEDALGLKVYQVRIKDSERKLEKTAQNLKEVQALRRELAPHIKFLSKQVEKIKQAEELRKEFRTLLLEYVSKEGSAIAYSLKELSGKERVVQEELTEVEKLVATQPADIFADEKRTLKEKLDTLSQEIRGYENTKGELVRSLGRIEGKLDALAFTPKQESVNFSQQEAEKLFSDLISEIDTAVSNQSLGEVKEVLSRMKASIISFTQKKDDGVDTVSEMKEQIQKEKSIIEQKIISLEATIVEARKKMSGVESAQNALFERIRQTEKSSYEGIAKKAELEGRVREYTLVRESLLKRKALLSEEVQEAEPLIGVRVPLTFEEAEMDTPEQEAEREVLHKRLERIKIKLEDAGGGSGSEIIKEFEETQERDAFLAKEVVDIEESMKSLKSLISELRDTIERTFKEGIEKINRQFGEFFKQMFNGGTAYLSVIVAHKQSREDYEGDGNEALPFEHGIEINVSLPHKKVKDLHMLSGGERSLVSIALLFAMSQVNPPPFLVLDETDAALDEANSRRYGDMLETLSKHSKLVVVTHNRETMSRAQVLYGVTMGVEGASKLLSIKFDEAVKIAK